MNRTFISPYKMASLSAKTLANTMSVKRVNGTKIFKSTDTIINWGNSNLSPRGNPQILNRPESIRLACNKLESFKRFTDSNVSTVEWTTDKSLALLWLDQGHVIYGRNIVDSYGGKGIIVMSYDSDRIWQDCPLYTKGIVKAHEYRVHVLNDKVIDIQKKRRRVEGESNDYIKNYSNGWVFCREEVLAPIKVYEESIKAVNVLGLDFGAVDILYKQIDNIVAVLEVNTSPGLEGQTLEKYKESLCHLKQNISMWV